MKKFSKTLTQTLPLKIPKNRETIHPNMVCQWKVFSNDIISYIVGNVLKRGIQQQHFQKRKLKPYHWKKPKNPEIIPSNIVCQWKFLNDSGFLYIIRKVIKRRLRWYHFLKRWLKLLPSETWNMVYIDENFFDIIDILYNVEMVLKNCFWW